MNKIKLFFSNLKMKYHSCNRNAELLDSYSNIAGDPTNFHAIWTTNVYKCKICGKIWDVD